MADAYSVMAQAKRQGAELNAIEKYNKYIDAIEAEEARASKAGFLGKLGGGVFGSIASFLAPGLVTALGAATGGLGSMLLGGLLGGGISRGGTEIGDFLSRQWGMGGKGRGKKMKDIKGMGALSGPYGQNFFRQLKQKGEDVYGTSKQTISDLLDVENMSRNISSIFSGITSAGKARSAFETLDPSATFGEKFMSAYQPGAEVGAGYRLGAKETGDSMKFGGRTMVPGELSEQAKFWASAEYPDVLSELSNQPPWTGYKPSYASGGGGYRPSYYENKGQSLLDYLISLNERGTKRLEFSPLNLQETLKEGK